MINQKQDQVEMAKMYLDQVLRDIGACQNYKSMPMLKRNLAVAKEELAYAIATNR